MIDLRKDVVTNLKVEIESHLAYEKSLKEKFPDYKVKYKKFSDIYVLRNNSFVHSIWYNPNKLSELKSERRKELKAVIVVNVILLFFLLTLVLGNEEYKWFDDTSILFEIFALIFVAATWLTYKLVPGYKEGLKEEHNHILEKIKNIKV